MTDTPKNDCSFKFYFPAIAALIGSLIGAGPGYFAYTATIHADYRQAKIKTLMEVLRGSDETGTNHLAGEKDGLYAFAHDPHIYVFNWRNLKLIDRNIRIPVRAYGADRSKAILENFYKNVEVATEVFEGGAFFPFQDGSLEQINHCFEGAEKNEIDGEPRRVLENVTSIQDDQRKCFTKELEKFHEVQSFANLLFQSFKCYGSALEESLMADLDDKTPDNIQCGPPPYLLTQKDGKIIIQMDAGLAK